MTSTPDTSSISFEDDTVFQHGLNDPSLLANQKRAKIFELLHRLHNTGVSADIDLPSIAVVGSQSVGKSSLIEAMSGIALPRQSGTCTRCPTECRLSSSEGRWQAQVSIRLTVDMYGALLQRPTITPFGGIITLTSDVEERIRRAQLAILNPSTTTERFLTVGLPFSETNELRFSKNSIILDISGPRVPDLAFVDLPGIIVSGSADGDERDIEDVETLVGSHIEKPNCLILLAVTCETDPENQRGRHLAKKYDANGDRTIPVLTKPDRIQTGDESGWMTMIRNQKEKFKHGWYSVRQPGPAELNEGITWEQARQNEREFFQKTPPWSNVEFDLRERLGTEKLSAALGQKLFDLIVKRLPEVSNELQEQLKRTLDELDRLPPSVGDDPITELLSLIRKFIARIENVIDGSVASGICVVQSATDAYEQFTKVIGSKTPRFRPFPNPNSESDEFQEFPAALELDRLDTETMTGDILHLDDILQMAKRAVTRELPGNYPYNIKTELIKRFLQPWERPSKELVQEVERRLRRELKKIVDTAFAEHTHGGLLLTVWNVVDECIRSLSDVTRARVEEAFKMEQHTPTTRRERHFLNYRNHYLEHYRVYYQSSLEGDGFFVMLANRTLHGDPLVSAIMASFLEAGVPDLQETDLLKLAPRSEMEAALEIMAEVRAYYHIAMQRYIEKIPMLVDHLLVLALKDAIPKSLLNKLPFDKRASCAELLRQADDVTAKRKEFDGRRKRLEDAREELNSVWVG